MVDIIVSIILVAIIGAAITYIVRSKKRGEACVGCPCAKECAMRKSGGGCGSSCNSNTERGGNDGSQSDQEK